MREYSLPFITITIGKRISVKARIRAAAVTGIASALLLAFAPQALANWSSYITQGGIGFESRRWDDQSYSQIQFTSCYNSATYYVADSVDVQMWRDISMLPDDSYDNKTFTACYSGGTSNGEWTDLPSSTVSVYFQIMKLGGSSTKGPTVDVSKVYVDTTKAD